MRTSRSYFSIVRANTLTIPNGILFVFGVLTIVFGSWKDALFVGILVSNIAIGSFQEVRSKRALDRLASLVAPQAVVVRDGVERGLSPEQVVVGDLVRLAAGDQVVADGVVVSADGLALDESNLTGESELVVRGVGGSVWSGSFAVEGAGLFEATAVGAESRAARLTATARAFRHPRSPLERANDRLLLFLVAFSVPLAIGLVVTAFTRVDTAAGRVQLLTAGVVNVVPEGLILLISLTAAVSALKVARRGVLAQQLNAVESLASVDVVCTDKTGTLTEPTLRVVRLVPCGGVDEQAFARALARYATSAPSRDSTLQAIADAGLAEVERCRVVGQVPFSSRRRWSALDLGDEVLVLGAPERFASADRGLAEHARDEACLGRRVLALGRSEGPLQSDGSEPPFPGDVSALGFVVLAERLRPNAADTVAFFVAQQVELKVFSGDAPATVGAIARDAGVPGSTLALDGETLPSEPIALREAVQSAPAVGRISPEGKRAVIEALAGAGRFVAMADRGPLLRRPRARVRRLPARRLPLLPAHAPGRPPQAARAVPLRARGAQGRRCRQRRHPGLHRAPARSRRQRSALPPVQGGGSVGARAVPRQERVRKPRPARRRGPAPHPGSERHHARLRQGSKASTAIKRDFYIRQLWDEKGSALVELMEPTIMTFYAKACGSELARAHARAGDAIAIASYLGTNDTFDRALALFAESYADQNERDYNTFSKAVKDGKIKAETGV